MMRIILLILYLSLSFVEGFAQNVWYVDNEATGGNDTGRDWTNAWKSPKDSVNYLGDGIGINWDIISAGDTIYISGGTDTTWYYPDQQNGIQNLWQGHSSITYTFASGDPVVICPSWEAGHNGAVVFATNANDQGRVFWFLNLSNIKIVNLTFWNRQNPDSAFGQVGNIGGAETGIEPDSMIVLDNCHLISNGAGGFLGIKSTNCKVTNSIFEHYDDYIGWNVTDVIGINSSRAGHHIDNNVIIQRNHAWVHHSGDAANVTITDTSLTDTDVNIEPEYYTDLYVFTDTFYMAITSQTANTFYGSDGWHGFHGQLSTPPVGDWTLDYESHRDICQISEYGMKDAQGDLERRNTIFSNNLIIDTGEEGTSLNAIFYAPATWAHQNYYYINNIIVTRDLYENQTPFFIYRYNTAEFQPWWQSIHLLNNTIITKGKGDGTVFTHTWLDTMDIRNNLVIVDTTYDVIFNLDAPDAFPYSYKTIDYNYYAIRGGIMSQFGLDNGVIKNLTNWRADFGYDIHSDTTDSRDVTFTDKYGENKEDYYTTSGRNAGVNLWNEFPLLRTDALGNARPESGSWDIGALQYNAGSADTVPSFTFTNVTGVELNSYHEGYAVFTAVDSTFHVWSADSFKVGALSSYNTIMVEADSGDTVYTPISASGSYSTAVTNTISAGGINRNYSVTTKAALAGIITKSSDGKLRKDSNGKLIGIQ